jgi:hypothetical protein
LSNQPLTFVHGTAAVGVFCDAPEFDAGANPLFQSYLAPPGAEPCATLLLKSIAPDRWHLLKNGSRLDHLEDFESAVIALEYELSLSLLDGRDDIPHLHASGFLVGPSPVLVLGDSGSGKTSLALTACCRGYPVFGDDVVLVDSGGHLNSFKRLFEVDPPRLAELGIDPQSTPFWFTGSAEAWFDPGWSHAGWVDTPAIPDLVVVARYDGETTPRLRELSQAETLLSLTRSVMATGLPRERAMDFLLPIATGARAVEMRFRDAQEAMRTIEGLVGV